MLGNIQKHQALKAYLVLLGKPDKVCEINLTVETKWNMINGRAAGWFT